jgi:hypothetical protein
MREGLPQGGFTLLEILAVATALIAPSFYDVSRPSPRDEARHLAMALRMAGEEASLSGRPMIWYAGRHAYGFEQGDGRGKWMPLAGSLFGLHRLPAGLAVLSVQPADAMGRLREGRVRADGEPVLARLLLMPPEGVQAPAEIVLGREGGRANRVHIRLRPGSGGIRVLGGGR